MLAIATDRARLRDRAERELIRARGQAKWAEKIGSYPPLALGLEIGWLSAARRRFVIPRAKIAFFHPRPNSRAILHAFISL